MLYPTLRFDTHFRSLNTRGNVFSIAVFFVFVVRCDLFAVCCRQQTCIVDQANTSTTIAEDTLYSWQKTTPSALHWIITKQVLYATILTNEVSKRCQCISPLKNPQEAHTHKKRRKSLRTINTWFFVCVCAFFRALVSIIDKLGEIFRVQ